MGRYRGRVDHCGRGVKTLCIKNNMRIKKGAVLAGLMIQMREVLVEADKLWKSYGEELVVTEGTGGTHSAGSLHYYGYAVDLRNRYFSEETRRRGAVRLQERLGSGYDVITHSTHTHVEYQRILEGV